MNKHGTTDRAWCKPCGGIRLFLWSGRENGRRPTVEIWRCAKCDHTRMQMADVTDAAALVEAVLDQKIRQGLIDRKDYEDALGLLTVEMWDLYMSWDPNRGVRFTAYATGLLRLRAANWNRSQLGRNSPKLLSIAISLDAPADDGDADGSGLGESLRSSGGDPATDRSAGLARTLLRGRGGEAEPRAAEATTSEAA